MACPLALHRALPHLGLESLGCPPHRAEAVVGKVGHRSKAERPKKAAESQRHRFVRHVEQPLRCDFIRMRHRRSCKYELGNVR